VNFARFTPDLRTIPKLYIDNAALFGDHGYLPVSITAMLYVHGAMVLDSVKVRIED